MEEKIRNDAENNTENKQEKCLTNDCLSSVFCTSKYGRTEFGLKIKAFYGADMAGLLNIST